MLIVVTITKTQTAPRLVTPLDPGQETSPRSQDLLNKKIVSDRVIIESFRFKKNNGNV